MSRALFVSLSEDQVIAKCTAEKVGISAMERLPEGGVRLVCMSVNGAEKVEAGAKAVDFAISLVPYQFSPI